MSGKLARHTLPDAAQLDAATTAIREALRNLEAGVMCPAEIGRVFAQIRRISELRSSANPPPGAAGAVLRASHDEYRSALEAWARHLPRVHGWLLAERQRLASRQEHVRSFRTWLDAQRRTR